MINNKHINIFILGVIGVVLICTIGMIVGGENEDVSANKGISFGYRKLFDHDKIMSVNIKVDESEWNSMIENAIDEQYIPCDVEINGATYENVGIRPKGNTSLTQIASDPTTDRYSLKIEFDHYVKSQSCEGLDKLILNNNVQDATYMKEYMSYELLNYAGVVTPLYNYASIKVNGKDWGFYLALEGMEESFALRNYGAEYGQLYKPETMGVNGGMKNNIDKDNGRTDKTNQFTKDDLKGNMPQPPTGDGNNNDIPQPPTGDDTKINSFPDFSQFEKNGGMGKNGGPFSNAKGASLQYIDDSIESYSTLFDSAVFKSSDSDYERVITAIKNLNEGKNLEKYVDVDAVLSYIAANTVLVNLDSYFSNMQHNYYLYEKNSQLTMLPWDYNLSFAGFQSGNSTSAVNFPIDTPVSGIDMADRPIIAKLFENKEYFNKYHEILQDIVDNYFNNGLFTNTINKVNKSISAYVENDPTAFYTYDEYKTGVKNLKLFGLLRAQSIEGQLNGTIPSTTDEQSKDNSKLVDASSVDLTAMGTQGGKDAEMRKDKFNNFGGNKNSENQNSKADTNVDDKTNANGIASVNDNGNPNGNKKPDSNINPVDNNPAGDPVKTVTLNTDGPNKVKQENETENIVLDLSCVVILLITLVYVGFFRRKKYRTK